MLTTLHWCTFGYSHLEEKPDKKETLGKTAFEDAILGATSSVRYKKFHRCHQLNASFVSVAVATRLRLPIDIQLYSMYFSVIPGAD